MKNFICSLTAVLVILYFAGCATTSDSGDAEQEVPAVLSWSDTSEKAGTPESPAPYSAEAPESPKQKKNLTLDDIFDETKKWPENETSIPVPMKQAEDIQYWDAFKEMMQGETDINALENYLLTWYGIYGWTPEFYAACHNFYFQKASILVEEATSENDIAVVYENLNRCFDACFHGAKQYPDRLDLWCGFVHVAIALGEYDSAESCIQAIFERLAFNGNNWYWTYNEPFYENEEDREREFVQILHDYVVEFLNGGVFDYAASVSEWLLTYFPDNAISLNDAALTYLYAGELEAARPYLERAVAADPEDMIVLTNLAYVCEDLGDYDAALEYASLMIMSGEEEYVDRGIKLCAELNQLMYPDK